MEPCEITEGILMSNRKQQHVVTTLAEFCMSRLHSEYVHVSNYVRDICAYVDPRRIPKCYVDDVP